MAEAPLCLLHKHAVLVYLRLVYLVHLVNSHLNWFNQIIINVFADTKQHKGLHFDDFTVKFKCFIIWLKVKKKQNYTNHLRFQGLELHLV